jgi:hypothetical protein
MLFYRHTPIVLTSYSPVLLGAEPQILAQKIGIRLLIGRVLNEHYRVSKSRD